MINQPILFIDSGIGGLSYCMDFLKKNQDESVYYLADNRNYPYGPRSKEELISILILLVKNALNSIKPKIIVFACNTATIAALSSLRETFPDVVFVGTVPAVKPAAEAAAKAGLIADNSGKIGVLGTERTIKEIQSLNLAGKNCQILGVAAPELVDFIELSYDDSKEKEKNDIVKKYIDRFIKEKADTIVLGCTHFLFLQDEFRREAEPYMPVFDSLEGISNRIEFLLDNNNLRACPEQKQTGLKHKLLLTGKKLINPFWEKKAHELKFCIERLDEYL